MCNDYDIQMYTSIKRTQEIASSAHRFCYTVLVIGRMCVLSCFLSDGSSKLVDTGGFTSTN